MEHGFTPKISAILQRAFGERADSVFEASPLLQYLNIKTASASRGSKSRGAFANHYAVYVLVEDYVKKRFDRSGSYKSYAGARFTDLLRRQRELPFGRKLQNHALNGRMNDEFKKYFPACQYQAILRDAATNRYWINERLLKIKIGRKQVNIAKAVLKVIDAYVSARTNAFQAFIDACLLLQNVHAADPIAVEQFITDLLKPTADARIFEIVSFSILKQFYAGQTIFWGWSLDEINEEQLALYKTGRTNANDGGIDFVMRPLGRFFQVTETTAARKYLLDIDKVQPLPNHVCHQVVRSERGTHRAASDNMPKKFTRFPRLSPVTWRVLKK